MAYVLNGATGLAMTETYKRIFLRWEIVRGWIPAIVFAASAVALEVFFLNYMLARGLVDKTVPLPLGPWSLPFSIVLFFSLGVAVVLLTLWMTVFENTAYAKAGPDRQVRRVLYPLRMVRVAALVLAPFTIILFLPYVIMSGWFVGSFRSLSVTIPLFHDSIVRFYNWAFGISETDVSTRFIVSQLSAALGAVAVGSLYLWRVKGTRNLMLLLRRRR